MKKTTNDFNLLYIKELIDLFCIEKESKSLVPKLQNVANDPNLISTLKAQLTTSNSNIAKLNSICQIVGVNEPITSECELTKALLKSLDKYLEEGPIHDIGILSQLERINNYKIALYNSAIRYSRELNYPNLNLELQNLANQTYNIMDRFARLNDDQSDERAIQKL